MDTALEAARTSARLTRAARRGALVAYVPFIGLLLDGQASPFKDEGILGGFYDAQAHAWLAGRWNVPAASVGIEGILRHGKTYEYFGPWPALLRLPIAVFTHAGDRRLSQLSMLLAFTVALAFTVRLVIRIRSLVRGDRAVTRSEAVAVGAFVFALGGASVLVFLASLPVVYHEAALWGTALTIAAFDGLIGFTICPRRGTLAITAALSTAALLSRPSIGSAPVVATSLIALATLSVRSRTMFGLPDDAVARRWLIPLIGAAAIPVAGFAAINFVRFGTLFSIPFDHQVFALYNVQRKSALAANHGSLFGAQFIPTALVQYLRPDALRTSSLFPWIGFPTSVGVVGNVTLATPAPTSSLPSTMPTLAILAVVGFIGLTRRRAKAGAALAPLRAPLIGTASGVLITLSAAYVAQRYVADMFPGLVLLGAVGLFALINHAEGSDLRWVRIVAFGLVVLGLMSVWTNFGLGLLTQRLIAPSLDEPVQARFVRLQYRIHHRVPGGSPPDVVHTGRLGRPDSPGTLAVVGDCDGVYWSDGRSWRAVARTPLTGSWHLRIGPGIGVIAAPLPLVASGTATNGNIVGMQFQPDGRVRFGLQPSGRSPFWLWGDSRRFDPARRHDISVITDPNNLRLRVEVDGAVALNRDFANPTSGRPLRGAIAPVTDPVIGRAPWPAAVAPRFLGPMNELPADRSFCRAFA